MSKIAKYKVLPSLAIGKIKNEHYVYDSAGDTPFKTLPTQNVSKDIYLLLEKLIQQPKDAALSLPEIYKLVGSENKNIVSDLINAQYLQVVSTPNNSTPKAKADPSSGMNKYYCKPTFFGIPYDFPLQKADVALLGVPLTSRFANHGVTVGSELIRAYTAERFDWFQIFKYGLYSEMNLSGAPRVICKKIVPKDYGNVGDDSETLEDIVQKLADFWSSIQIRGQRPLFIGGDHGISFLTLQALAKTDLEILKKTTIVHLDAHNDCYGDGDVSFNHASVIHSILSTLPVKKIVSFGLRTWVDQGAANNYWPRISKYIENGRLIQYGVQEMRELLQDSKRFSAVVGKDCPVYFTFDLDFLCSQIVDGAVWTPVSGGGSWSDVYKCIEILGSTTHLIGADIVEYNPNGLNASKVLPDLSNLMLLLTEVLANGKHK